MANTCGDCTACCTMFPIAWLDKPAFTPCVHCDAGCRIHDTKAAECSDFECSWLQSNVANDDLRPDRCGIVFEKLDDTTFYGTVNPETGATERARNQVRAFIDQGFSVKLSEAI